MSPPGSPAPRNVGRPASAPQLHTPSAAPPDGAVPSLFVLAAAAALKRRDVERDPRRRALFDEVLLQNRCGRRGAELALYLAPKIDALDSPPPLNRRPPLLRQNAFRHRGAAAAALPPEVAFDDLPAAERRRTLPPRRWLLRVFRRGRTS
jgi:hypothetical protein